MFDLYYVKPNSALRAVLAREDATEAELAAAVEAAFACGDVVLIPAPTTSSTYSED